MSILSSADHHNPLFPRGAGLGLRALVLLLACGGLMASELDGQRLESPREWLSWALQPVMWLAQLPSDIAGLGEHFRSRERLQRENAELRLKQLQLEAQLQRYAALEAENRRIRELLHASGRMTDQAAIADIIASNQDPYRQQITLDKGARDGVYRGQAIVDANGVVGQIVQVNPSTAVGLLLTDPDHGIPVEVNRTGLQAIALGQGLGQGLRIPFLPANAEIQKGDLIVSSALGGRFPAGYPVARVEYIHHTPGGHFKEAIVTPAAKLGQSRQALLVWSERPPMDEAQAREATAVEQRAKGPAKPGRSAAAPAPAAPRQIAPAPAAAKPNPPSSTPTTKPQPSPIRPEEAGTSRAQ